MNRFSGLLFILLPAIAGATDPYPRNDALDVRHYAFQLEVNDSTDVIAGVASIDILFRKASSEFELDLTDRTTGKDGMAVEEVKWKDTALKFVHANNRLKIMLAESSGKDRQLTFVIRYHGIPRDGLIIGKNKFGDRGFFGDNWPDRGHHWLPVIDHPSDKAGVDFTVIAPLHYSVVANGIKIEESLLDNRRKLTRYHEAVPLPVKTMVVGIARFAVQHAGAVDDIAVESWVYPQNREAGFSDYAVAVKVLDYFHRHVGPYPYRKLANVQSKTRWGGLENANTIFYYENSVTGKGQAEPLIAHEEAHQWFGNCVSEDDWHHVWLSEGFATYFCNLYLEYAYGHDRLVAEESAQRDQVIRYAEKNAQPIVDTTVRDINTILNTNTYQKAGWVLHMLRRRLGDDVFWKGIRQYYTTYNNGNALTDDFQRTMEEASGTDLTAFFKQWIWTGGHPKISWNWTYNVQAKAVEITFDQLQKGTVFQFPLEIGIRTSKGEVSLVNQAISTKSGVFTIPVTAKPADVLLDPGTWLLFEAQIKR